MRSFVVRTSVGPERSPTETNGHNKPVNLRARLPDSPLASAKPREEQSAYACDRLVTQDRISVHVNPAGGLDYRTLYQALGSWAIAAEPRLEGNAHRLRIPGAIDAYHDGGLPGQAPFR